MALTSVRGPTHIYYTRIFMFEYRQEVPLHERCLDPWPYPHRPCRLDQDDAHPHHPPRLPPLHPQVQCVSKSTNTQISPAHYFLSDRYEKRHKNLAAHVSPAFRVELGDVVTVGQCRPLSKTVRFNVIRVQKNKAAAKAFAKF